MNFNKYRFFQEELQRRSERAHLRRLRPVTPLSEVEVQADDGRKLVNFCSNDYLGLSKHPLIRKRGIDFMERYGAGSTASRLVCGTFGCVLQAEAKLAALKGTETALILNSGYQANISVLPALADEKSLILSDALNHRSIIEGCRLSRARVIRFRHNDAFSLKELLEENSGKGFSRIFIVTESVFSVDGDRSDLETLARLADAYGACLIVDEAHATGVLGKRGMGLSCGVPVDVVIGTFGKACGSFGAYVACSNVLRDYLVNCCAGFIYTTALPPSVIGSIDAALDLVPTLDAEREALHRKAETVRRLLCEEGWNTGTSETQIIPVIVGGERETLALSKRLEAEGILAMALRPPTVPNGQSRIRLAITACHTDEQIQYLVESFNRWRPHGSA